MAAAICRSYAARGDHACFVSPQNCNPNIMLKKKPSEYLNQLYFDAMVFTPEALRHLVAQVGASQVDARHRPSDPLGAASGRPRLRDRHPHRQAESRQGLGGNAASACSG